MDIGKWVRKIYKPSYCGAVIVAAGSASRMGGIDKVMAPLQGEPMIVRTVRAFENCELIREIVIVTRSDLIGPIMNACGLFSKVRAVVAGGSTRQESVHMGLNTLSDQVTLAAIHDGARPLVSDALICRTVKAAEHFGAAIPGIPVKDTIKIDNGGLVGATPDRATLRAIQTPQVFDFDLLRGAMAQPDCALMTDDSAAVEKMGMTVKIVEGDEKNLKVTTPLDLAVARMLLEEEQ